MNWRTALTGKRMHLPRRVTSSTSWSSRQVETAIKTRQPKEYDRAVELLKDLRDLAQRHGTGEAVTERMRELREHHGSKRALIQRLDRAGLPK